MVRALLTAVAVTVAAMVVWVVVLLVSGRMDMGADLQLSAPWSALVTVLYAAPFAVGAWAGTRAGLRALPPAAALRAGAGGALAVFVAVTLSSGGTDLLSVVLPFAGTALGVGLALRGSREHSGAPADSPGRFRRGAPGGRE